MSTSKSPRKISRRNSKEKSRPKSKDGVESGSESKTKSTASLNLKFDDTSVSKLNFKSQPSSKIRLKLNESPESERELSGTTATRTAPGKTSLTKDIRNFDDLKAAILTDDDSLFNKRGTLIVHDDYGPFETKQVDYQDGESEVIFRKKISSDEVESESESESDVVLQKLPDLIEKLNPVRILVHDYSYSDYVEKIEEYLKDSNYESVIDHDLGGSVSVFVFTKKDTSVDENKLSNLIGFLESDEGEYPQVDLNENEFVEFIKRIENKNEADVLELYSRFVERALDPQTSPITDRMRIVYQVLRMARYKKFDHILRKPKSIGPLTTPVDGKEGEVELVKKGAVSEVFLATFETLKQSDEERVIKFLNTKVRNDLIAVQALGIDSRLPRLLERNLFVSSLYDKVVSKNGVDDLGVMIKTDVAILDIESEVNSKTSGADDGALVEQLKNQPLVLSMERVNGKTAGDFFNENGKYSGLTDKEKGVLARDLTRIHYLDYLFTQVDRNVGNYMVVTNSDGNIIGLKAFDNDFSLAGSEKNKELKELEKNPQLYTKGTNDLTGNFLLGLPDIADESTKKFFDNLTAEDINEEAKKLSLTKDETNVLLERKKIIDAHLKKIGGNIIKNAGWEKMKNVRKLEKDTGEKSRSYLDILRTKDSKN